MAMKREADETDIAEEEGDPLSVDESEMPAPPLPKRPAFSNVVPGLAPSLPSRPSLAALDQEVVRLRDEVSALKWLLERKEKEWDQVLRLLKTREEALEKAQRSRELASREAALSVENIVKKFVRGADPPPRLASAPMSSCGVLNNGVTDQNGTTPKVVLNPPPVAQSGLVPRIVSAGSILPILPSQVPVSKPTLLLTNSSAGTRIVNASHLQAADTVTASPRVVTVAQPTPAIMTVSNFRNLTTVPSAPPAGPRIVSVHSTTWDNTAVKNKLPLCQGCNVSEAKFMCAGCSRRRYCSKSCQLKDWDAHDSECKEHN